MAGFAVVMAIFTYGLLGALSAAGASIVLFFAARKKLLRENKSNRAFVVKAISAPFLCLAWLVISLLIHVQISNKLAHQDCGLSGDPYVTLPNGYEVGSHNTYDGYIRAPGAQTDVPVSGPGYVRSIVTLRFQDGLFTGTQFDFKSSSIRQFTLNAQTKAFQSSEVGPTSWEAANDKSQLGEESYWRIYAQYRHRWPNYILFTLIAIGEGAIVLWIRKTWIAS